MQLNSRPRQTPQPKTDLAKSVAVAAPRLTMQGPNENGLQLFSAGGAEPLSKTERAELLDKVRAGESVELEFEAVTFIQRDTPNRNFVRFQPAGLAAFAKSFAGVPFLMNHDSYDVKSRGGTVISSKLETGDDNAPQMRMRIKAVKSWAVEGLLDGTIDRFSISWDRGGAPMLCSLHDEQWWSCSCRLGEKNDKGKTVELVVQTKLATGTEVSTVNVPAVVGTFVGSISQLEAIDDPSLLADILGQDATRSGCVNPEIIAMDPKTRTALIVALGLKADATDEQIADAAQVNATKLAIADKAAQDAAAELKKLEDESAARALAQRTAHVEAKITELKAAGKLLAQNDPDEVELRKFAASSLDVFDFAVKTKLGAVSKTPVGAPLPALKADPQPTGGTDGKSFLSANPHVAASLKKAGVTVDEFEKHGEGAREWHSVIATTR